MGVVISAVPAVAVSGVLAPVVVVELASVPLRAPSCLPSLARAVVRVFDRRGPPVPSLSSVVTRGHRSRSVALLFVGDV